MCPNRFAERYAGLGSESVMRHLQELGVTAVELLPVHYHLNDRHLVEKGLTNYWGYNTLNFFAPENDYVAADSPLDAVMKFKTMVRNLHSAGIEVILDVVYNHTAEGNQMGPTLRSAASITPRTIGCRPRTRGITWISPAAATRCTCKIRACCS